MANDKVQLKREELVGNDVVLEDINPKSNTKSIVDDDNGLTLEETINRLWNAINNKVAREVNSVNGRTGVVVLNASDVGLGNVDNVSYADIQDWVIKRIELEFANKQLHLFDSLDQVEGIIVSNDVAYKNSPFYAKTGFGGSDPTVSHGDKISYIGYFYWDDMNDHLAYAKKSINVIGWSDSSIIYNEEINGKDYTGGRLGVNIWKYEDALEIYNVLGNKGEGGLRVVKDKVANIVYFFDGCYGVNGDIDNPDPNAFLDISSESTQPVVTINIDDESPITAHINTSVNQYKLHDIVICNFNDANYRTYDDLNGVYTLKTGINQYLVNTQPKIGVFTSTPTIEHPEYSYSITFHSLKPFTNFGLGYYNGADVLGAKPITGKISNTKEAGNVNNNLSGVTVIGNIESQDSGNDEIVENEFNTVTPVGPVKTKYYSSSAGTTVEGIADGMAIVPDMSLNVIPNDVFGKGDEGYIPNWPLKTAGDIDDRTGVSSAAKKISYLGVNLDKSVQYIQSFDVLSQTSNVKFGYYNADENKFYDTDGEEMVIDDTDTIINIGTNEVYHKSNDTFLRGSYGGVYQNASELIDPEGNSMNLSGLKITHSSDVLDNLNQPSPVYRFKHSGGLAVNTGNFLEIGSGGHATTPTEDEYYETGKLNVSVDRKHGLYEVPGDSGPTNKLGVALSEEGGLVFDILGDINVNLGIGMKMSKFNKVGITNNEYNFVAPCINDMDPSVFETTNDVDSDELSFFGGLRYLHNYDGLNPENPSYSALGVRINNWYDNYDEPIRHGNEGLKITNDNVLGVQPLRCENDVNPIVIKRLEDFVEEQRGWTAILPLSTIIFTYQDDETPGNDPRQAIVDKYNTGVPSTSFGAKLLRNERSYVVKVVTPTITYTRRYVYVGDGESVPTVDDYENQFEYFTNMHDFDRVYPPTYQLLTNIPGDWSDNCVRYYKNTGTAEDPVYEHVEDGTAWAADTYYILKRFDSNGKPINQDKIFVIGRYGEVSLYTWGPKKRVYFPDVDGGGPPYNANTSTPNVVDIVSADDASAVLREYTAYASGRPSTFTDEQKIRGNFDSSNKLYTPDDASLILLLYTALSTWGAPTSNPYYVRMVKQPEQWFDSFDDTTTPPNVKRKWGACYAAIYDDSETPTTTPVYYLKRNSDNEYIPLATAHATDYANQYTPSFVELASDTSTYDGNVYVLAYGLNNASPMDTVRTWLHSIGSATHDDPIVDELVKIDKNHSSVYILFKDPDIMFYESGVDINIAETRGVYVTKPKDNNSTSDSFGVAVKIYDQSTGDENLSTTNESTAGGLRYGPGGGLAIRVNTTNEYDANTGAGSDKIATDSAGAEGIRINPSTNVLGVRIPPNSVGGLAFDENGCLTMTGFVALQHQPADWASHQSNYFKLKADPAGLSEAELEYRKYHRNSDSFEALPASPAETFVAGQYYTRIFTI